ncbi:MAG: FtsW/RodA/SpoVE family cell cycle protein [Holdemanella sp.]|nr:FtsW/RodA/SpoVE family cell cycle protein [Holdemanella sp.]
MKQTIIVKNKIIRVDLGFIAILVLLGITSCFAIYNSFNLIKIGTGTSYLIKQIFWYGVGFFTMFILSKIDNKIIYEYMYDAYIFLMLCLLYLFISRITYNIIGFALPLASPINGAISWFQFPLIGSFQPSEFIKIVLIVLISQTIKDHQDQHENPTFKDDFLLMLQIAKLLLPPMILIFLQPDTGVCIIIAFCIMVLLICSGIRKVYVWILLGMIAGVIGLFLFLYFKHPETLISLISAYRFNRIEAWLDPESNIRGSSNQLYTALLSLGSAGLTGHGLQANIISIPEAHTDFIFAAFGQCFGLIGTTFILVVCLILDLYLCKIAYNTTNRLDRFIVIGVIGMLLYQQLQNLGMIVGLLPITGITLPLISYGGSSILSYFIAFSIVLNLSPISKRTIHINRPKLFKH